MSEYGPYGLFANLYAVVEKLDPPQKSVADLAIRLYEAGHYEEALPRLQTLAEELELYSFAEAAKFPISACKRVVSTTWNSEDYQHAADEERMGRTPQKILKQGWGWIPTAIVGGLWRNLNFEATRYARCKYCGHYTPYIDPDKATAYFGNKCGVCGRSYPMPSARWDSPRGRAMIYEGGSATEAAFYSEFENDYPEYPRSEMADRILGRKSGE